MVDHLDIRLHFERLPAETIYKAEHALEAGFVCIGFVFRNPTTQEVQIVFDRDSRILTDSEARRLLNPAS